MSVYEAVKSLTLTRSINQPSLLDYSAEVSFLVSFGKMSFTVSGSLDAQNDPPQSMIYEAVLSKAFEELRKTPTQLEPVMRYKAWEAAGKPPYAVWCIANYPTILN